jgi:hypothetical protein
MMSYMMMAAFVMSFTVNPDGSCKVDLEITVPPVPAELAAKRPNAPLPEQMANEMARSTLGLSGVNPGGGPDAWANVTLTQKEDGGFTFKGTAYFKDMTKASLGPARGEKGVTWEKDALGRMVLTVDLASGRERGPAGRQPPTDDQVIPLMAEIRKHFKADGDMIAKAMAKMKMEIVYRLPGATAGVEGFTKDPDGSLHRVIEGPKVLEDLNKTLADDALLQTCLKAGHDPMEATLMKHMGGVLKARVEGAMKPQFDYAAEVKAAKEAFPKMIEKLGLDKPPAPPAAREKMPAPAKAAAPANGKMQPY